jgi:hypothetical protein
MTMQFAELSADQRRQFINAKQSFEAWREADQEFRHTYRGEMRWRKVGGREYLSRKYHKVWNQVGPRSPETERIKDEYTEQRTSLRSRLTRLNKRLDDMRPLNRAMGLGRVPRVAAQVLRMLDQTGFLGRQVSVAGTHALYAYEARSGVLFEPELTATTDIDLLWDVRRRFTFLMQDVSESGIIGLLRKVDKTFRRTRSYSAENADPYIVEFIRPERKNEATRPNPRLTRVADDLEPAPIDGLAWLINAPKFEEIVMGEDGRPLLMCCIDPRAFALHKLWLSRRPTREGIKRRRDELQARAVAAVATQFMGLTFDRRALSALPKELTDGAAELARARLDE